MLPFTKEEYQERVQKVKSTMAEKGMDVLFLVEPANMNWVSGYDAMSFYVPQGVVVSLDEEMPYWIGRFQDQYSAHVTTWLDDEHIRPYADKYLCDGLRRRLYQRKALASQDHRRGKRRPLLYGALV